MSWGYETMRCCRDKKTVEISLPTVIREIKNGPSGKHRSTGIWNSHGLVGKASAFESGHPFVTTPGPMVDIRKGIVSKVPIKGAPS